MNCMKCGVEIPETQVFCDHCLSVMAQYPVKPGTHIHLPKRDADAEAPKKAPKKKRGPTPEEQLSALRLKVLRLRLVAVILVFVICVIGGLLALELYEDFTDTPNIGLNYTIDTSMGR